VREALEKSGFLAGRQIDHAHEGGARRANVDQRTIDAIKYNRGVEGLPEKDALAIRFGADSRIDTLDTRSDRPGLVA